MTPSRIISTLESISDKLDTRAPNLTAQEYDLLQIMPALKELATDYMRMKSKNIACEQRIFNLEERVMNYEKVLESLPEQVRRIDLIIERIAGVPPKKRKELERMKKWRDNNKEHVRKYHSEYLKRRKKNKHVEK